MGQVTRAKTLVALSLPQEVESLHSNSAQVPDANHRDSVCHAAASCASPHPNLGFGRSSSPLLSDFGWGPG